MAFAGYIMRDDADTHELTEPISIVDVERLDIDLYDESDVKSQFEEMLDECYPEYEIAGVTLYPSEILRDCDPVAYRGALYEYECENFVEVESD